MSGGPLGANPAAASDITTKWVPLGAPLRAAAVCCTSSARPAQRRLPSSAAVPRTPCRYARLYQQYKVAVQGAHFSAASLTLYGAPLYEWKDPTPRAGDPSGAPSGIAACSAPPLLRLLAAPRLPPELERHLQEGGGSGQH